MRRHKWRDALKLMYMDGGGRTSTELARECGVSLALMSHARTVVEYAPAEIMEGLEDGTCTFRQAYITARERRDRNGGRPYASRGKDLRPMHISTCISLEAYDELRAEAKEKNVSVSKAIADIIDEWFGTSPDLKEAV